MGLENKLKLTLSSLALAACSSPIITENPAPTYTPFQPLPVTETPLPTQSPVPTNTYTPEPTSTPLPIGKKIVVDISDQMIYAYTVYPHTEVLEYETIVSTGTAQNPTVIGEFNIWIKLESTRMTGPGYDLPNVPYTMYFFEGYGIHGTYWHNNFGTPMSHGCVNLKTEDAKWFYEFAEVGTPVIVRE